MEFFLKKLISSFLAPLSLGLFLLFLGLFYLYIKSYKRAKVFLSLGFIWIVLISYAPFSNTIIQPLENNYTRFESKNHQNISYIAVLGSYHHSNEKFSVVSQGSGVGLQRLNEGISIYKKYPQSKLILTGYKGHDKLSHAIVQKNIAIALGVPSKDIIINSNPKDTKEEAIIIKRIVKTDSFVLVTSAAHMTRAIQIFNQIGLTPIAAPTNYLGLNFKFISRLRASEIQKTESAMHEYFGIVYYKLKAILN